MYGQVLRDFVIPEAEAFGIAVFDDASVFVVSLKQQHKLGVFALSDGTFVRDIGGEGIENGQLQLPHRICAVEGANKLLVCDFGNFRVQEFTLGGHFVREMFKSDKIAPYAIAHSAATNTIAVGTSSRCGNCVHLLDYGSGVEWFKLNVGEGMHRCFSLSFAATGMMLAVGLGKEDRGIMLTSLDGEQVVQVGDEIVGTAAKDVAFAKDGRVIVADVSSKAVHVFETGGALVTTVPAAGALSFGSIIALTVCNEGVLVVDAERSRVQLWRFA
jgi:hypothetical protein